MKSMRPTNAWLIDARPLAVGVAAAVEDVCVEDECEVEDDEELVDVEVGVSEVLEELELELVVLVVECVECDVVVGVQDVVGSQVVEGSQVVVGVQDVAVECLVECLVLVVVGSSFPPSSVKCQEA